MLNLKKLNDEEKFIIKNGLWKYSIGHFYFRNMEYITERSKQEILDSLTKECAKYNYDRIQAYYDEDYDCIDVTMKIKDDLIIISRWFDDEEEFMVEIYNKDKKSICVVGSEDSIKKYFENENWRENFI